MAVSELGKKEVPFQVEERRRRWRAVWEPVGCVFMGSCRLAGERRGEHPWLGIALMGGWGLLHQQGNVRVGMWKWLSEFFASVSIFNMDIRIRL